jgi:hypothetical protein
MQLTFRPHQQIFLCSALILSSYYPCDAQQQSTGGAVSRRNRTIDTCGTERLPNLVVGKCSGRNFQVQLRRPSGESGAMKRGKKACGSSVPADLPRSRVDNDMEGMELFPETNLWAMYHEQRQMPMVESEPPQRRRRRGARTSSAVAPPEMENLNQDPGRGYQRRSPASGRGRRRGRPRIRRDITVTNPTPAEETLLETVQETIARMNHQQQSKTQVLRPLIGYEDPISNGGMSPAHRIVTPWIGSPRLTRSRTREHALQQLQEQQALLSDTMTQLPMEEAELDNDIVHTFSAPESQHGPLSMSGTQGTPPAIDVIPEDGLLYKTPIPTIAGVPRQFYTTSSRGHSMGLQDLHAGMWINGYSTKRKGTEVKTSQKYLSEQSEDERRNHALVYGTICSEYIDGETNTPMFIVDYGGDLQGVTIAQEHCIFPSTVDECSNGEEGDPSWGRVHLDFSQNIGGDVSGKGPNTVLLGADTPSRACDEPATDAARVPIQRVRQSNVVRPIRDYSDEAGPSGTQESTARRTPFPQVTTSLPSYLFPADKERGCEFDSSGEEWLADEEDWLNFDEILDDDIWNSDEPVQHAHFDDNVDVENDTNEMPEEQEHYEDWFHTPKSYLPFEMSDENFDQYYDDSNWTSEHVTLLGNRNNFSGPRPGFVAPDPAALPHTPIQFFNLFWPDNYLQEVVLETNRYASQICTRPSRKRRNEPQSSSDKEEDEGDKDHEVKGVTNGGSGWTPLNILEFRAWLGIKIYMGIKRLPCKRDYWSQSEEIFSCKVIPNVMSCKRWEAILRCLHLTDNEKIIRDPKNPAFDKGAKVRPLLKHFTDRSKALYNLERELTIDELVVPYKGKYTSLRMFMRGKPKRFGMKFWCLASAKSKYVHNVSLYEGKGTGKGPCGLGHQVCMDFLADVHHRGHVLVCDSFFSSPRLFHDLLVRGTWATGTVRSNRLCIPENLHQECDNERRGRMVIRVHRHRQMACLSWRDSDVVYLLSTASDPWAPNTWVLRRRKGYACQWNVPSSPMHLEYQRFMRGVDVTDQLRASYPTLLHSHKWWHKCFSFILDQSLVNAFIIHEEVVEEFGLSNMTHKKFNLTIAEALVQPLLRHRSARPPARACHNDGTSDCFPQRSTFRRKCVLCSFKNDGFFCAGCNYIFLCFKKGCFREWHQNLRQ